MAIRDYTYYRGRKNNVILYKLHKTQIFFENIFEGLRFYNTTN